MIDAALFRAGSCYRPALVDSRNNGVPAVSQFAPADKRNAAESTNYGDVMSKQAVTAATTTAAAACLCSQLRFRKQSAGHCVDRRGAPFRSARLQHGVF